MQVTALLAELRELLTEWEREQAEYEQLAKASRSSVIQTAQHNVAVALHHCRIDLEATLARHAPKKEDAG